MSNEQTALPSCPCGKNLAPSVEHSEPAAEIRCDCGRMFDLERFDAAWLIRGELVPEGSVPVGGFSLSLRNQIDVQRWRFEIRDLALRRLNVHIVFSPALAIAEVKHSDLKPLRLTGVASAAEARRRWIDWFEAGPRAGRPAVRSFRRVSGPAPTFPG